MRIAGEATLRAPVDKVWDALLDPAVLVRTIPGCERLEATGENAYAMTVTAGVAAIKGTYSGTCELRDLEPHQSLVMSAQGAGAPGTIAADVTVGFRDNGDGTTSLDYDADTTVGGMIGGVGQRMLSSASKRMAGEFFNAVEDVLHGAVPSAGEPVAEAEPAAGAPAATAAGVFTRPPRATDQQDFLKGVAVGAGLVLLGVVVGAIAGRRR
jgi:carbon monoxide dehydrogenase subunit G